MTPRRVLELVHELASDTRKDAQWELEDIHALLAEERALTAQPGDERELAFLFVCLVLDDGWPEGELRQDALGAARNFNRIAGGGSKDAVWHLSNLASALIGAGRLGAADRVARLALDSRIFPDPGLYVPRLLFVRSEVARKEGRWVDAGGLLEEARSEIRPDAQLLAAPELRRFLPVNRMHRARYHSARAASLLELGLVDRAIESIASAAAEAELSGLPSAVAAVRQLQIDVALLVENFERAAAIAREARQAEFHARLAPGTQALFTVAEGKALASRERLSLTRRRALEPKAAIELEASRAEAILEQALEGDHLPAPEKLSALQSLVDLHLARGDSDLARARLEEAEQLLTRIGGADREHRLQEEALLAVHRWRLVVASGGAVAQRESAYVALQGSFDALLDQWAATPHRPGGVGFLNISWRQLVIGTLIDATESRRSELGLSQQACAERCLGFVLRAQAMGTVARSKGLEPGDLGQIRGKLLAEDRGLLLFVPSRDASYLFSIDDQSIQLHRLVLDDELGRLAAPILRSLSDLERRLDPAKLIAMRDALLPELAQAELATWREVFIVGLDLVDGLPFEILPAPQSMQTPGSLRAMGDSLAVANLPSIPFGLAQARESRPRPGDGEQLDLVLITASSPPGLQPFTFGPEQRARLMDPFLGRKAEVLESDDAKLENVLGAAPSWSNVRVLHFLCHGVFDDRLERGAALALGSRAGEGRGLLHPALVEANFSLSGLVILSACATGAAPLRSGDDQLAHLGAAFLEAGASCVVLSRHRVEYAKSIDLFGALHHALARGASTAEAMREARDIWRKDPFGGFRRASFRVLGQGFESPLTAR